MQISKSIKSSFLFIILSISILPMYQNCGNKVDFGKTADFALTQGEAEIVELNLSPTSWENRPQINITAIVDNSNSMEPIQEKVAKALERSLAPLEEFSGKIEIFTTTQWGNTDGSDKQSVYDELMKDGKVVNGNVARPYSKMFRLPASYTYTSENNQEPIVYNPSSLADATIGFGESIRNLGTAGSSKEEGLCSLLRVVEDKSENSNGSFNAILLVSNEDDATDFSKCLKEVKYLVKDITRTPNQNCSSEADIAAYSSCKYKNTSKLEKKKKLTRLIASYSNKSEKQSIKGPNVSRAILKTNYKTAKIYKTYNKHKLALTFKVYGNYKNDGIVSGEKWFNHTGGTQDGQCSNSTTRSCSDSEFDFLKNQSFKIDGRLAELQKTSCEVSCIDKGLENINTKVYEDTASCEYANSVLSDSKKCNGELNCDISCSETNRNANYTGSTQDSCNSIANLTNSQMTNELYSNLKLSSSYYNNSGDRLVEIREHSALNWANVECQSGNTYYKQEFKNGYPDNMKALGFHTSAPSDIRNDPVVDCSLITSESLNDQLEETSPANRECRIAKDSTTKTITENLNIVYNPADGSTCDVNELSSSNRNNITNDKISFSDVDCSRTSYDKDILKLCELPQGRVNLCNSPSLFEASVSQCADLASEANSDGGEFTFSCNKEIVGQYTISVADTENVTESLGFVPDGSVDNLSAAIKNKLGQFQLATFTTPAPSDPNYASCVSQNPEAFSTGSTFVELVDSINAGESENLASSFSICESDYSPALSSVVDKVIAQAEYSYRLDLNFNESVYKVYLVDNNGAKSFVGPDKYYVNNGLIHFRDKSLITENVSSISVQIWRDLVAERAPSSN